MVLAPGRNPLCGRQEAVPRITVVAYPEAGIFPALLRKEAWMDLTKVPRDRKCKRCGRPLRSHQSVYIGLGWVCLGRVVQKTWEKQDVFRLAQLRLDYTK